MLDAKAKRRQRDYVRRGLKKMAARIRIDATISFIKSGFNDEPDWEQMLELADDLEKPHRGPYERYDVLSEAEVDRLVKRLGRGEVPST